MKKVTATAAVTAAAATSLLIRHCKAIDFSRHDCSTKYHSIYSRYVPWHKIADTTQHLRSVANQLLLCEQLTSLELQYVSPKLLLCHDMELAVPGTYDPNQPVIMIHHLQTNMQVITSKQRPRKLIIFGQSFHITALTTWD